MHKKLISFSILCLISISLVGCSSLKDSSDDNKNNNIKESTKDSISINDKPVISNIDTSNLDNAKISWFFVPNDEHKTPTVNTDLKFNLSDYNAVYNGQTNKESKTLYLTFDEGYENGYTPKILDVLKEKM
nr:polysaccharide deacetylase family protein [[Clostridium] dakarense]